MFGVTEAAFDDVAVAVVDGVIADRSPTVRSSAAAVPALVGGFWDDGDDASAAQVLPDRSRGVGLVCADAIGSRAWSTRAATGDVEVRHQDREHRRITSLPGPDEHHQWQSVAVDELVDLAAQTAARPANSMIRRLGAEILVIRQVPLCPG